MRWSRLLVPVAFLALASCRDAERVTGPTPDTGFPAFRISDAVHEAGQPGFYFLPPIAADPGAFIGVFDAALAPTVKVCALAAGECTGAEVAELVTGGRGSGSITVDPASQSYNALWRTKGLALDPGTDYRLRVYVGSRLLGWVDLDVVATPKDLKGVAADEVGLVADQPLTVKFRIETGIVGAVSVAPTTASVTVGGTQQFTASLLDLHGVALIGPTITWGSSDAAVATVSATGLATGVAAGTATIAATSQGIGGTAALTVTSPMAQWTAVTHPAFGHFKAIWGSGASDVFAAYYGGNVAHYDGTSWSAMTTGSYQTLTGIWGFSASDVYAAGGNTVVRYNGSSWSAMAAPSGSQMQWINDIWGTSATDLYVAGDGSYPNSGTVLRWDGTTWTVVYAYTYADNATIHSIWGSSSTDIWAVGGKSSIRYGQILHYGGGSWLPYWNGTWNTDMLAVWGIGGTIFAVGDKGTIVTCTNAGCTQLSSGTTARLYAVWGSALDDVYAVGSDGWTSQYVVLHYDGTSWTDITPALDVSYLNGIWGSSATDVFFVGDYDKILHYGM